MGEDLVVRRAGGGDGAGELLDAFLPAYTEVYAEPPYREGPQDVAEFVAGYPHQVGRPGFRLVFAESGREVVGFSFGYRLAPDTAWWDGSLEPLPGDFTRETGHRTFAVIELAVRARWRRRGVAARLHGELVRGLAVERLTLTVRPEPEAAPARAAYAAWNYHKVGRSRPWDGAPLYDLMVRDAATTPQG
ncbi:GNAT family N-acetyltransferase [Streptomyces sp. URMC 129]|uniref:GNAT family N-acetyltransferase n=1 Tax=Streptomyces sp. URMC 129 TaxID=3423407 RepID=UPI003F1B5C39